MKLSANGCFKNLLCGGIQLTDYFAGAPRSQVRKETQEQHQKTRSGTNLIFQLTGVPSRKEASNQISLQGGINHPVLANQNFIEIMSHRKFSP